MTERIYIPRSQRIELQSIPEDRLPEYLRRCGVCDGDGCYDQTFTAGCGMGSYKMVADCDYCHGAGIVYECGDPLTASVIAQLLTSVRRHA